MQSLDANKNGIVEPDEVPEDRKRILGYIAQRAGIEIKGPISISKFREALASGRGGSVGGSGKSSSNEPEPLVPGFGTDMALTPVPGFGERIEESSGSSSTGRSSGSWTRSSSSDRGSSRSSSRSSYRPSSSSSSGSRSDRENEERIRGFAKSMIKRYDTDGSGVVEKHEWGNIRGDPNEIDTDHNGKITEDEMAKRLMNYSRGRSSGDRSDSSRDGRSGSSRSGGSDDERDRPASYRFKTAMESLPEGLPPWFSEQDASGDGQVSMAEYSSYWDDRKAEEFVRLDLNGDGLITSRECLDAPEASEVAASAAAPAGSPSGSSSPMGSPSSRSSPSQARSAPTPQKPSSAPAAEKPWWE